MNLKENTDWRIAELNRIESSNNPDHTRWYKVRNGWVIFRPDERDWVPKIAISDLDEAMSLHYQKQQEKDLATQVTYNDISSFESITSSLSEACEYAAIMCTSIAVHNPVTKNIAFTIYANGSYSRV